MPPWSRICGPPPRAGSGRVSRSSGWRISSTAFPAGPRFSRRWTRGGWFWNAQSIQEFWSGSSFMRTDDGNQLSYDLARILVDQLSRNWPDFAAFVGSARRQDAGATAAHAVYASSLGSLTTALLDMPPDPAWDPAWDPAL